MRVRFLFVLAVLCVTILAVPERAAAQASGALMGTVTDESGVGLAAVLVTTTGGSGVRRSVLTGADGAYELRGLPQGSYTFTFSLTGFKTVKKRMTIASGASVPLNVQLTVDSPEEHIIVKGEVGIIDSSDLEVRSDTAIRVDVVNGTASRPTVIDNTNALKGDAIVSERAYPALFGVEYRTSINTSLTFRAEAQFGTGNRAITIARKTGGASEYSGNGFHLLGEVGFGVKLGQSLTQDIYYRRARSTGDVVRDPATSAIGGSVSRDEHRITNNRFTIGTTFNRSFGGVTLSAGAEYFNFKYTIGHQINIDYSPTVQSQFDGATKLKKTGGNAILGVSFPLGVRFSAGTEARVGKDFWAARLRLRYSM